MEGSGSGSKEEDMLIDMLKYWDEGNGEKFGEHLAEDYD